MENIDLSLEISRLLHYGLQQGLLEKEDLAYSANRMLALLGAREFTPQPVEEELPYPAEPLERVCDWAAGQGLLDPDTRDARDQLDTEVMNCMMPRPSQVAREFYSRYQADKKSATDYYYHLSRASHYIRVDRVEKDKMWTAPTEYGDLVITINLSKPEKDPKAIAAARNAPQAGYPKCALCRENEGYLGSLNQAARGNHRLIPLTLGGEPWYLQYSPYVYYNEHCIVFSEEHRPMVMNQGTFSKLAEFVEKFPCYFLGSNACLPIVGGSILTHEHFQGGGFIMPMHRAAARETFAAKGTLRVQIADWYNSVIRLTSPDREEIVAAADEINEKWKVYSNPALGILAETDQPHNAVTPIFRKAEDNFVAELILRNNRTDETYPDGIFHAHPEYHGIKKEGIGIIEVMGLFILPGRLDAESAQLAECLTKKSPRLPAALEKHRNLFDELKEQAPFEDVYAANKAIRGVINRTCVHILENTAVFKADDEGQDAFRDFVRSLSFVEGKSI